ncbi:MULTISPECIES: prepilin-type N-terminal cleavage/methylation domain-containing protein [Pseudomonas]|uniref:prepilin-type N-terminal cleavage/methylation domain-containing protein n=1 Tax=Pseudomonas TaxID=286 RepID=UPI000BBDE36B|nr:MULTISPECIES: prepilin-type N-terminal cleavage/methylation domain-containing protein [Pseudomonas]MCI3909277.1 prepilin-type N-terminal cleavage/methylation domain-containing protein [Pseudomonas viridiflava]MEE4078504.1 prepilin-type N-terminal cleavage/methylation domain-containing protein [Pseudomonas viridiflava]MEE4133960.1 prepilin-type N-terminal cleavage/methylation domain-containing protein [Pseudomonas viridiflava]MEE4140757.1 prepilin-type N-terminal cleavage/methylation domain-c
MKGAQRGFTLLEVLLVISLLGVLLVLVAGALLGGNRAVLKAERYTVGLDEMRAAQAFLRSSISQALPLDTSAEDDAKSGFFEGTAQDLRFVATLPGELGGGIQLHTLGLKGPEGDRDLQVAFSRIRTTSNGITLEPWGEPQVLLHNVQSLNFSYRGLTPKGKPTGWLNEWPWPTRLPGAVRIDAQVKGSIPWVSEVVALRLDLSGGAGGQ